VVDFEAQQSQTWSSLIDRLNRGGPPPGNCRTRCADVASRWLLCGLDDDVRLTQDGFLRPPGPGDDGRGWDLMD
jgi:hypothetical protein